MEGVADAQLLSLPAHSTQTITTVSRVAADDIRCVPPEEVYKVFLGNSDCLDSVDLAGGVKSLANKAGNFTPGCLATFAEEVRVLQLGIAVRGSFQPV